MNRNVMATMSKIFDFLTKHISEDDQPRIANVKRHIRAQEDDAPVCAFVQKAHIKPITYLGVSLNLFKYKEHKYLLIDDRFSSTLNSEIGFEIESDTAIILGAAMLAITDGFLPLRSEVTSLDIIERCLGIPPDTPSDSDVTIEFSSISSLFIPYCVIQLDDSRFPILYEEDITRLVGYLIVSQLTSFDASSKSKLKDLLLLLSSRSIAFSILGGLQSPLIEYTFLQFYQCIEYLFKLNNCFEISSSHSIPKEKAMDIILSHELKISESENLYKVLKDNASEQSIDSIINVIPDATTDNSDKFRVATKYIYRLRCNIAHLRYDQDDTSNINWKKASLSLIEVIFSIYQKCDADIIYVCTERDSWKALDE